MLINEHSREDVCKSKKEALEKDILNKNQIIDRVKKELDKEKLSLKKFEGWSAIEDNILSTQDLNLVNMVSVIQKMV